MHHTAMRALTYPCCLRSSSTSALDVPSTRLSTVGDRAFPVAAARTWNSLPAEVTLSHCLQTFKTKLKSHLLLASFPQFLNCYRVCEVSEVLRHFFTLNLMLCNVMLCNVMLLFVFNELHIFLQLLISSVVFIPFSRSEMFQFLANNFFT